MGGLGPRSVPDPVRSLVSQRIRLSSMVTVSPAVRGRWSRLRRHDLRIAHVCTPPWGHSVDRVGPICQPTVLLLGQHPYPIAYIGTLWRNWKLWQRKRGGHQGVGVTP